MDISIVICTYNPTERIFLKCLNAVCNLKRQDLLVEVLIIDNNSSSPLNELPYIKNYLSGDTTAKYLREQKPGLIHARINGVNNSKAPIIVFFDDDNEPEENYLLVVHDVLLKRPAVGMLGPGIITVDYIDGSSKWLETKRRLFQEKTILTEAYDTTTTVYRECYPFGTGLVVRRDVMDHYYKLVSPNGEMSGRIGNALIGGEDIQIVWAGIKAGYVAGCTPLLKVNHIIGGNRTGENYIKKLHYSLGYSDLKALLGVFPEREHELKKRKISLPVFYFILAKCIIRNLFNAKLLTTELIPSFLGKTAGYYYAFNEKKPGWLRATERIFGLNYYN